MSPERWAEIERLHHAALPQAVEQRAFFLTDACAGDDDLRQEVESLLNDRDQGGDFIEIPAAAGRRRWGRAIASPSD